MAHKDSQYQVPSSSSPSSDEENGVDLAQEVVEYEMDFGVVPQPAQSYMPFASEEELRMTFLHYYHNQTRSALDRYADLGVYDSNGKLISHSAFTTSKKIAAIPELYPHLDSGKFTIKTLGKSVNNVLQHLLNSP
jgi:hypothetical protein